MKHEGKSKWKILRIVNNFMGYSGMCVFIINKSNIPILGFERRMSRSRVADDDLLSSF